MTHNNYGMETLEDVQISEGFSATKKTGNEFLDSFLSKEGGLLSSAVYLFTGSPGAGKTTISNYIMAGVSTPESPAVFMSFEMPKQRIKKQFQGKIDMSNIMIIDSLNKSIKTFEEFIGFLEYIKTLNPSILVIDSLQNVSKKINAVETHVATTIIEFSQNMNCPSIIIGQCTKDGNYKGDSRIKHDIDGHLHADLDIKKGTRRLVFEKNRDGKAFESLAYKFTDDGSVVFVPFSKLLDKEFTWLKAQDILKDLYVDILTSELKQMLDNGITTPQLKFNGNDTVPESDPNFHPEMNIWMHNPEYFINSTVFISIEDSRRRFTEAHTEQLKKQFELYTDHFPQFKTATDLFFLKFFVLMTEAILGTEKKDKKFFKTLERIINNHS